MAPGGEGIEWFPTHAPHDFPWQTQVDMDTMVLLQPWLAVFYCKSLVLFKAVEPHFGSNRITWRAFVNMIPNPAPGYSRWSLECIFNGQSGESMREAGLGVSVPTNIREVKHGDNV